MRSSFFTGLCNRCLIITLNMLLIFATTSAIAQVQKEERHAPPMEQLPQEQNQLVVVYDDEIKEDELPDPVISSIGDNYQSFEIKEAFRGSDGSYKINLEKQDTKVAAFYDAGGEFIRIEKDNQEETINDDWR